MEIGLDMKRVEAVAREIHNIIEEKAGNQNEALLIATMLHDEAIIGTAMRAIRDGMGTDVLAVVIQEAENVSNDNKGNVEGRDTTVKPR